MGSTGDPPVPSGDPPDGTGIGIERKSNTKNPVGQRTSENP